MRAEVSTNIVFRPHILERHNHHHAWTERTSCGVCRIYGPAYVTYARPATEPLVDVWGGTWTERELEGRLAEIARENAQHGLSDGRVTEGNALREALGRFEAQRLEEVGA